jgi:hypothetical protein
MGIKYAHKYTYSINGLSLDQLYIIASNRFKQNQNNDEISSSRRRLRPSIDIDVSWVIRGFAKGNVECRVGTLLRIATAFTDVGFYVKLVCDGILRHHSKRATIKRKSDQQKKKIELVLRKSQMMILSQRIIASDSIEERAEFDETKKEMQTKILKLENEMQRSSFDVGELFLIYLHNTLSKLTGTVDEDDEEDVEQKKITICISMFQADSVMASRITHKESEILLTCDSDQAALLGVDCMCIKNFKIKEDRKKTTIENIDLFFADARTYQTTINTINIPNDSKQLSKATYPVFDGVDDPRLRALVAVSLGCDVNLRAILTPAALLKFLNSPQMSQLSPPDAYHLIKNFIMSTWSKKNHKNSKKQSTEIVSDVVIESNEYSQMIDVFVDAFLFEPSNIIQLETDTSNNQMLTYIHHAPTEALHPYIREFQQSFTDPAVVDCHQEKEVIIDNSIQKCIGFGGSHHYFMKAEGHCFCSDCNAVTCFECIFKKNDCEKNFCYECYLPHISVGATSRKIKRFWIRNDSI